MQLGGGGLAQHGQNQLDVGHVVAQILARQGFHLLVFVHPEGKGALHDLVGENGELLAAGHAALLPLIRQVLPHGNAAQALVDPLLGVTLFLIQVLHAAHGQLGVLDFVQPLFAHLGQPAFERLGLGAGDGLDQAKYALRVPALQLLPPACRIERQPKGGDNLSPPLAVQAQSRVAPAHLLPVVRRVRRIGQRGNDVGDDKPPLVVVQCSANLAALEQGHTRFGLAFSIRHGSLPREFMPNRPLALTR